MDSLPAQPLNRRAIISDDRKYRYWLSRNLPNLAGNGVCVFVMLNPSTADAEVDDPTIRRCINFAESFGCKKLIVVNLFAYRATKPADLAHAADPVGVLNDDAILAALQYAKTPGSVVICAWGADKMTGHRQRSDTVIDMIRKAGGGAKCLGLTLSGAPRHPLYLPNSSRPMDYRPSNSAHIPVVFNEKDIPF